MICLVFFVFYWDRKRGGGGGGYVCEECRMRWCHNSQNDDVTKVNVWLVNMQIGSSSGSCAKSGDAESYESSRLEFLRKAIDQRTRER